MPQPAVVVVFCYLFGFQSWKARAAGILSLYWIEGRVLRSRLTVVTRILLVLFVFSILLFTFLFLFRVFEFWIFFWVHIGTNVGI